MLPSASLTFGVDAGDDRLAEACRVIRNDGALTSAESASIVSILRAAYRLAGRSIP
jgi:hypothetical protein